METLWYQDETTPYRIISRSEGHLHGTWEEYFPDGTPNTRGAYVHGLKDGLWESFWPSGAPRSRKVYTEGVPHGLFTEWFEEEGPEGPQVQFQGDWVDGLKHGTWHYFQPDGSTFAVEEWEQGTRVSISRH